MKPAASASDADDDSPDTGVTGLFKITGGALRPVEALFRNTVEHAPIGIAFANRDGSFRHGNRAFCAMLGYELDEFLLGKSILELTHPDEIQSTHAGLERLWRGDIEYLDVEKRYLRKDGSALWVRVTTSLVSGGGPEPECSVEFLRDISKRKELAAELLQNQTLLATVIAELPLALIACDVAGKVTQYNRAAVKLFGISEEEGVCPIPRDPYPITAQVFLPDGKTPVGREKRPLARAMRGTHVSDAEFVIVRPDGAVRTVVSSAQPLVGPNRQPLGAVAVVEDITAQRLAEEELERVHKQLMVASRQAGMAEVATNVLHNVGNVLNSVNISASLVTERVKQSKVPGVSRLAALLQEKGTAVGEFLANDERGRRIPEYLTSLGE